MNNAGSEIAGKVVYLIAPISGRNIHYGMSSKDLEFDDNKHKLTISLIVSFEARDWWRDVPYGECQISGNLEIYFDQSNTYAKKAYFYWKKRNNHIVRVSKSKDWKQLDNGLYVSFQ